MDPTLQGAERQRGCLFYIRRGIKWFGIALVILILLGIVYQTVATEIDNRTYAPRGQFYTVNGHPMHMVCLGEGSPTVVLQAGATAEALWWYRIQHELAEHTRVCAYDRAGLGFSEPASSPRDPLALVGELHTLLAEAGIPAPYVLAGHSFGAVLTRIYAEQYPDEVVGIVLVDSQLIDEPFADEAAFEQWKASNNALQYPLMGMARVGLLRLIVSGTFSAAGYPPEIAAELAAHQARNQTVDNDYAERITAMWVLTQASADAKNLGDVPLIVIWTSIPEGIFASDTALAAALARRNEFATFSTNTVIRIVEGASHISLLGNEQHAHQVSTAILDVMTAVQTGEPLAQ